VRWIALALSVPAIGAAPAHAASWSTPSAYDRASCHPVNACVLEPAPRVAVNARGAAVAAWVDTHGRVRVAIATRPGHFGAATTLASRGLRPATAIGPDGTITVVWQGAHGTLRFARRAARGARFAASAPLAARGSKRGDDSARVAAQPDGSAVVVYESADNVRTVTISPAGTPGAAVTLGKGGFGHDSVRAAPDGTLAACCIQPVNRDPSIPPDTATKVAVYRSAGGWRLVSAAAAGKDDIETVFGTASALVLGTTRVLQGGDAGVLGVPGLARAGADDVVAAPLRAPVTHSNHGLAPDVTIDGSGRSVLVFQEKTKPQAFQRTAPVYASVAPSGATTFPTRRRLDGRQAYQPTIRPLGPGAIAAWQAPGSRWGVAIERDGRFRHAPTPSGPGPAIHLGEDFNYAYDLATSGDHAVLAWIAADGSVRLSELD
jgi:hypothetical protein